MVGGGRPTRLTGQDLTRQLAAQLDQANEAERLLDQLQHAGIGAVRTDVERLCHDPKRNDHVSGVMDDGHGGKPVALAEPKHRAAQSSDARVLKSAGRRGAGHGQSGNGPGMR